LGAGKKRDLITGNWEFKDPSGHALAIHSTESDVHQSERMWAELQGVNLESICKSIVEGNASNCYCECSKLVLAALAVGHGGEVAFLRYDLCWWDDIFQCLEAIWS
jgi:hypothetical protein